MDNERLDSAVRRIETALGRIADAADAIRPAPPSVSALVVDHEELRDSVSASLKELDDVIAELEK